MNVKTEKKDMDNAWNLFPTQNIFTKPQKCKKKKEERRGNEQHVKIEEKDIELIPGGCS